MAPLQFNEEAARRLQILYSTPDMRGQRAEALRHLALKPGEAVIDIGSGPGYLCEDMAKAVGANGRVLGVDVSQDLVEFSRSRNRCAWLSYRTGDAMALDVPAGDFDAAVSMQVLEYLPDADLAMKEMARVLKPGGRALVVSTDWDAVVWHSENSARMDKVRRAWEAHCTDPRLPRTLAPRLNAAGFVVEGISGYPIINARLGQETYSGGILQFIIDFVRKQNAVPSEELDDWAAEQRSLSEEGRYFFSTMRYFFLAHKSR